MDDIEIRLRNGLRAVADAAPTATELLDRLDRFDHLEHSGHERRRRWVPLLVAALVLTVVVATVLTVERVSRSDSVTTPTTAGATCPGAVRTSPLPTWARTGFTPAAQSVPHVVGERGDIVGVLFGGHLHSTPGRKVSNKILWVSRFSVDGLSALKIHAELDGSDRTADREIPGGPGPSIVDLPEPGCWTVTLSWSGHTDTVSLPFE